MFIIPHSHLTCCLLFSFSLITRELNCLIHLQGGSTESEMIFHLEDDAPLIASDSINPTAHLSQQHRQMSALSSQGPLSMPRNVSDKAKQYVSRSYCAHKGSTWVGADQINC